ncbi:hypothetical protein [Metallosphaera javensis (ex Sakai et al. 2022)]|uniref:hypothetical protein n=1 Tax=Metallosphaera javensis (ex Sakai et al. 2022) TaxID=2775498 RepID=UPI00258FCCC2|nr:MAG: hypothetical protein MjAS7_0098 [Metallosphaera javensis (ex Sakai et al. 2022)]
MVRSVDLLELSGIDVGSSASTTSRDALFKMGGRRLTSWSQACSSSRTGSLNW